MRIEPVRAILSELPDIKVALAELRPFFNY